MPEGKGYSQPDHPDTRNAGDARANAGRSQGNTAEGVSDKNPETRGTGHRGKQ